MGKISANQNVKYLIILQLFISMVTAGPEVLWQGCLSPWTAKSVPWNRIPELVNTHVILLTGLMAVLCPLYELANIAPQFLYRQIG